MPDGSHTLTAQARDGGNTHRPPSRHGAAAAAGTRPPFRPHPFNHIVRRDDQLDDERSGRFAGGLRADDGYQQLNPGSLVTTHTILGALTANAVHSARALEGRRGASRSGDLALRFPSWI